MKWLTTHIGLVRHIGDFRFKKWLDKHASEMLTELGVGAGHVILDFSCGAGTYTIPAEKLVGTEGTVYALDIDQNALRRLMRKAKRVTGTSVVRVDAFREDHISLRDETLDLVLLIDVLQENQERKNVFEEIRRLLKPDGIVAIYPMHVEESEVVKLATSSGLRLRDRNSQGRVLIFRKSNRTVATGECSR